MRLALSSKFKSFSLSFESLCLVPSIEIRKSYFFAWDIFSRRALALGKSASSSASAFLQSSSATLLNRVFSSSDKKFDHLNCGGLTYLSAANHEHFEVSAT